MDASYDKVKSYYAQFNEWNRLDTPAGRLEKQEALHILSEILVPSSTILDLGSGPGRYAIELAGLGHQIALADISATQIDIAKKKFKDADLQESAISYNVLNATDLSIYKENFFDAVICFGPYYHLTNESDRKKCAAEIMRVCKPGGKIIIAFISKFTGLAGLISRAASTDKQVTSVVFNEVLETGAFHNKSAQGFQEGYYPTLKHFKAFWTVTGLQNIQVTSTRSFMQGQEDAIMHLEKKDPELFDTIINAHRKLATEDTSIEAGGHALLFGNKSV